MKPRWTKTSFHVPPEKLKTAQAWTGEHVAAATVTAIALLPGPVNGPQSTWAGGSEKALRPCWSVRMRAVAIEQTAPAVTGEGLLTGGDDGRLAGDARRLLPRL